VREVLELGADGACGNSAFWAANPLLEFEVESRRLEPSEPNQKGATSVDVMLKEEGPRVEGAGIVPKTKAEVEADPEVGAGIVPKTKIEVEADPEVGGGSGAIKRLSSPNCPAGVLCAGVPCE